ncbi:MAG: aminotransferase class I/II-fold pyridoxal phosphate-dependent enzyme [Desulfobacterales bacterium]|jgi:methionine-gamma-lyase
MDIFDPEEALASVRREFGEHGGVTPSISRSSTFTVMDPSTMPQIFDGVRGPDQGGCFLYSRQYNPTVAVLGRYLSAMENTEAAACTASGMAAISCTLMQLCRAGDHIVASPTIYGGTHALLNDLLPQNGIRTSFADPTDITAVENAVEPRTRVLYVEAIANPTLMVADLPALARLASQQSLTLVVDNTFSPMMLSPFRLGADVVVYSLTKFVNGASDLLAGAICGSRDFIRELMDLHTGRMMLLGPTLDPRCAFDVIQRLPHLALRMREHGRRALAIAQHLKGLGVPVVYPGLDDFPQRPLLDSMMNPGYGYGGVLTIDCGTRDAAEGLLDTLQNKERFGLIAVSLGYFDTLMSCSGASTSSEISPEKQRAMGLSPGLLRLSIGLTGRLDQRIDQLERALRSVGIP